MAAATRQGQAQDFFTSAITRINHAGCVFALTASSELVR
jgi:hypothetical protein